MEGKLTEVPFGAYGELEKMCKTLWHEAYDGLIGPSQVGYMLEKFQSESAFYRQIREENYRYFFIEAAGKRAGYCALKPEREVLFLSKLYLFPEFRGTGVSRSALSAAAEIGRLLGYEKMYLTVNKENARAIRAYEKFGFTRADSVVSDIGGGYVMDDYIYEYRLGGRR